jgi:hypothetical protein
MLFTMLFDEISQNLIVVSGEPDAIVLPFGLIFTLQTPALQNQYQLSFSTNSGKRRIVKFTHGL